MSDLVSQETSPPPLSNLRRKALVDFGLFFIFFVFYVIAAVVQTPSFRAVAAIPALGMPLGMLLSLLIFPVSWILIVIWFWKAH